MSQSKKQIRQEQLLNILKASGYEKIEDMARELSVSEQTIRRDIHELDQDNRLRKTHGGAAFVNGLDKEQYLLRRFQSQDNKQRIAIKVASLIPDGASLFLDAGTTCEAIAAALQVRKDLKIVTYSLGAAMQLKDRTDFTVAISGGFLRHSDGSVMGSATADFIRRFRFDYCILSVTGVEENGDMCDDDHWEVSNALVAMEQAKETILAFDSSKFYKSGLVSLGTIATMDHLVTDNLPEGDLKQIVARVPNIHLA
ncbi:DeoR/GlpR family DNA-binding transcription regulator [Kiloniella sp. b19]|uniref:DeoR/GlpR family DNA-binding transcription regulator n=1 Tax=Kiloniella sp. GXU_MW_B19 TaxID=3141326 RepID=UPI0031D02435